MHRPQGASLLSSLPSSKESERILPYVPQSYEIYVLVGLIFLPFVIVLMALLPFLLEED